MERNNNSNKNIKLQIKSFYKKISLQKESMFKFLEITNYSTMFVWQTIKWKMQTTQHGNDHELWSLNLLGSLCT